MLNPDDIVCLVVLPNGDPAEDAVSAQVLAGETIESPVWVKDEVVYSVDELLRSFTPEQMTRIAGMSSYDQLLREWGWFRHTMITTSAIFPHPAPTND